MTIVFTGGSTGGHFYPLIAIAEAVHDIARERRLVAPRLYFLAPEPFDAEALYENEIDFVKIPAGKIRRYFAIANITGFVATFSGLIKALFALYRIYPDVVISKGGHGSVPTTLAARFLKIPVIIHESDAKPGRANLLASKWAERIGVAFESAIAYFPKEVRGKIARTGIPIRKELMRTEKEGGAQLLGLDASIPTIFILGGSLGSEAINSVVAFALPDLVSFANVIHQTGRANLKEAETLSHVSLAQNPNAKRYKPVDYMNVLSLQRAAGAASVIVSRAGATAIAEIAYWGKPAILVPIPEEVSHDQRTNAYAYAKTGAASVLEQGNLTPHLLASECKRIINDPAVASAMSAAAKGFTDPDAAKLLASEAIEIALSHETPAA